MGEPIRVLRVIARLNVGGPSLHVSYLTKSLAERGYETTLVAGTVGAGEGSMEYAARELGVEPVYIPELQREIVPGADLGAAWHLRTLIRELRPQVLHTHTAKAGAVGRVAALLAGDARPQAIVHTFHGHVLRGYFSPPVTAAFGALERRLARITDALVAVSPQVRGDLVRLRVAPAARIAVIRLGLDLEARIAAPPGSRERLRRELGLPDDAFLVGWLGRMTEIKRVETLLEAFAALRASTPTAILALVGDGPLRPRLERRAERLGIAEACRFVGYRVDVGPLYAGFDALALSSANEGTPVSVIEAQAARLPVVCTEVGGVGDVVLDGETGILVPVDDPAALAHGLVRLAADPALRRALGDAGRARVLPRYSVPRLVDDVDRLYRTLLQVRAPAARRTVSLSPPLAPALPAAVLRAAPPAPRRLRIVLLSQYFPPEVGATQSRMQSFAEYLAARGHEVTVICEFPNHPAGVIPERYRHRVLEDDRSNPYRVLRVWVWASSEKTQATRIAFYLSYMALATAVAPLAGRADVVVATSPPLFSGVAGLAIARLNAAPFVLDVRDLWPAAAVSLRQISDGIELRAAELVERTLYREAAAVVAVTRPFCSHIDAIRMRPPATVHIPNGTLEQFFVDGDRSARASLGVPDGRFLVTFAGTHGIAQALPSVLDAAGSVGDSADFALVGEGPLKDQLVEQARERGLANVSFHDQVALEEIPPVLSASDALLVPLSGHSTFRDFVPSKMIDFMAAGKPIVLSAAGEAARILERAGGGVVVPPEDPEALAGAVRWLSEHPDEAAEMARRGREFARRRLRDVQAERLEQLLLSIS